MTWFGVPKAKVKVTPYVGSASSVSFSVSDTDDNENFYLERNLFPMKLIMDLPTLKERGVFLCGGAALALYLGQNLDTIKDYDFYCKDVPAQKWFEEYLTHAMLMTIKHVTNNALTYEPTRYSTSGMVQIIVRNYYPGYQEIFNDFDFSVCKIGYEGNNSYVFGPNTQQHILEKKLVLEGRPTADFVKRWFKYTVKGFKMPRQEAANIIKALPEINLDATKDLGY